MSLPRYTALASRQNAAKPSSASSKLAGSLACLENSAATRSAPFLVHCLGRSETTRARRRAGRATTPTAAVSTAAVGRFIFAVPTGCTRALSEAGAVRLEGAQAVAPHAPAA